MNARNILIKSLIHIFLGSILIMGSSCTHDPADIEGIRTICFDTEVLPIFRAGCATTGCHDATAQEGLRLDSYSGIMAGVNPGNSGNSEIYEAIVNRGEERMPPDYPLSKDARMLIRIWIDQGAEEVICLVPSHSVSEAQNMD